MSYFKYTMTEFGKRDFFVWILTNTDKNYFENYDDMNSVSYRDATGLSYRNWFYQSVRCLEDGINYRIIGKNDETYEYMPELNDENFYTRELEVECNSGEAIAVYVDLEGHPTAIYIDCVDGGYGVFDETDLLLSEDDILETKSDALTWIGRSWSEEVLIWL